MTREKRPTDPNDDDKDNGPQSKRPRLDNQPSPPDGSSSISNADAGGGNQPSGAAIPPTQTLSTWSSSPQPGGNISQTEQPSPSFSSSQSTGVSASRTLPLDLPNYYNQWEEGRTYRPDEFHYRRTLLPPSRRRWPPLWLPQRPATTTTTTTTTTTVNIGALPNEMLDRILLSPAHGLSANELWRDRQLGVRWAGVIEAGLFTGHTGLLIRTPDYHFGGLERLRSRGFDVPSPADTFQTLDVPHEGVSEQGMRRVAELAGGRLRHLVVPLNQSLAWLSCFPPDQFRSVSLYHFGHHNVVLDNPDPWIGALELGFRWGVVLQRLVRLDLCGHFHHANFAQLVPLFTGQFGQPEAPTPLAQFTYFRLPTPLQPNDFRQDLRVLFDQCFTAAGPAMVAIDDSRNLTGQWGFPALGMMDFINLVAAEDLAQEDELWPELLANHPEIPLEIPLAQPEAPVVQPVVAPPNVVVQPQPEASVQPVQVQPNLVVQPLPEAPAPDGQLVVVPPPVQEPVPLDEIVLDDFDPWPNPGWLATVTHLQVWYSRTQNRLHNPALRWLAEPHSFATLHTLITHGSVNTRKRFDPTFIGQLNRHPSLRRLELRWLHLTRDHWMQFLNRPQIAAQLDWLDGLNQRQMEAGVALWPEHLRPLDDPDNFDFLVERTNRMLVEIAPMWMLPAEEHPPFDPLQEVHQLQHIRDTVELGVSVLEDHELLAAEVAVILAHVFPRVRLLQLVATPTTSAHIRRVVALLRRLYARRAEPTLAHLHQQQQLPPPPPHPQERITCPEVPDPLVYPVDPLIRWVGF